MRQYRELSDMTKQKISQAMKGKSKSLTHKENISIGKQFPINHKQNKVG